MNTPTPEYLSLISLLNAAVVIIENSEGADDHDEWLPAARAATRDYDDTIILRQVAAELTILGYPASVEYPGWISLRSHSGLELACGTAGGDWGCNDGDGNVAFPVNAREHDMDAPRIARAIVDAINLHDLTAALESCLELRDALRKICNSPAITTSEHHPLIIAARAALIKHNPAELLTRLKQTP